EFQQVNKRQVAFSQQWDLAEFLETMELDEHKNSKKEQAKKNIVSASNRTLGVDINTVGSLDRTRADITDYFNYSFNEYTWKAYCTKQKQMREDQHARKKIH
ncbi:19342_t:CDS:2, partial [Gigaspora rosea]